MMLRSIISVLSGYLAIVVLTILFFFVLGVFFPQAFPQDNAFPATPYVILILFVGLVVALFGGFVTAALAVKNKLAHVVALSAIVLIGGVINAITNTANQPLWYLISLVAIGILGVFGGGCLRDSRAKARMSGS